MTTSPATKQAKRRHLHLNQGQKAVVALDVERLLAVEAKERQIRKPVDSVSVDRRYPENGKAAEITAKTTWASARYVAKR